MNRKTFTSGFITGQIVYIIWNGISKYNLMKNYHFSKYGETVIFSNAEIRDAIITDTFYMLLLAIIVYVVIIVIASHFNMIKRFFNK